MNDPEQSAGAMPQQDTVGAILRQDSVGAILRQAREAQGLSVQDAASRLRLMNRQIEAMEGDDFEVLGQPVFARGFVRNYARLLRLDPAAVLQKMVGGSVEPTEVRVEQPVDISRPWFNSMWLLAGGAALLLLIAMPVLLYFWLNSGEEEAPPVRAAPPVAAEAKPVPPPLAALPAEPAPSAPGPAVEPAPAAPALPAPEPELEVASVPAPASWGEMHFEFADDAWVEIRDATGKMVHRQMDLAGSTADVSGQPPFSLVIGNAAQVRMTYNGRPIDLKPFIDVKVARFNLEH